MKWRDIKKGTKIAYDKHSYEVIAKGDEKLVCKRGWFCPKYRVVTRKDYEDDKGNIWPYMAYD